MMKLGRLLSDPIALAKIPSLDGHRFAAMAPPPYVDRSAVSFVPGLYQNNVLPDCTAVALVNAAQGVAAVNGWQLDVDPNKVPAFYAKCIGLQGYTMAQLAATPGASLVDVLHTQLQGYDIGTQTPLVGIPGQVPLNKLALASAIARLRHAYIGVWLRERDMETVPGVWDAVPGRDDGKQVGGHAVFLYDYTGLQDTDTVRVGTWGMWQHATWRWLLARCDEAHALVWRQLDPVDADVLVAQLGAIAAP
jgi:hypothetical protein